MLYAYIPFSGKTATATFSSNFFLLLQSLFQAIIYDQHNMEGEEKIFIEHQKKKKDSGKRHLALATRHRRRRRHEGLVAGRFWRFYGMGWGLNWSKGA